MWFCDAISKVTSSWKVNKEMRLSVLVVRGFGTTSSPQLLAPAGGKKPEP